MAIAEAQPSISPNNPDNIIEDRKSLAIKDKVMARLKPNTWLNSVSKVATFIGGPLMAAGLTAAAAGIFHGGIAGLTWGSVGTALTSAALAPALGMIAAGAIFVALAVGTDYIASRIWQGCNFDNLEANADSTARHLVKELKTHNMCMVEHNAPGIQKKDWAQYVEAQRQQQATGQIAKV